MTTPTRPQINRPRRRPTRPSPEALEPRVVLSGAIAATDAARPATTQVALVGETLMIEGTPGPDHILVGRGSSPDAVRVASNGRLLGDFGAVRTIEIGAGSGNDLVLVGLGVTVPTRIEGGADNDRLRGGAGPDLVFGDDGDDLLVGATNRDALDAGPGSNRVVVPHRMGEIRVGPSAGGEALRILSRAYTLRPMRASAGAITGPMVVGAADLGDPGIVDLLQRSYEDGHTIALANATAADADLLRGLLGHQSAARLTDGDARADLVTFRQSIRPDGQSHESTNVLMPQQAASTTLGHAGARRRSDSVTIEALSGWFSKTPVVPQAPPGDSPENNLLTLAESSLSSTVQANSFGDQVQIVNLVWSVRSFKNSEDFYYVLQEIDYHIGGGSSIVNGFFFDATAANTLVNINVPFQPPPTLIQTSPQTTQETTSVTSGVSFNLGGSAGYNQMQGLNATGSAGVTISNSKTVTIPPFIIDNQSNPLTGQPNWKYQATNVEPFNSTITFYNQWISVVPFGSYSAGETSIVIDSNAAETIIGGNERTLGVNLTSEVPLPFGTTRSLQPPVVTSVSPTSVASGDTFTITGTGLYPSLVQGVLIDGTPLDPGNFTTVSDTAITVVAPDEFGLFLPVVVQTSQGTSNDNVTIEINDL